MNALETQARAVATAAEPKLGFDPFTIVMLLLPMLMDCFKRTERGTVADFVEDHYDEHTNTYDQRLIDRCRPQARRAARRAGSRHLTREQLDALTIETLDNVDTSEATVAACAACCPAEDGE